VYLRRRWLPVRQLRKSGSFRIKIHKLIGHISRTFAYLRRRWLPVRQLRKSRSFRIKMHKLFGYISRTFVYLKTKMASCTSATEVGKLLDKIYRSWDTIHVCLCRRRWLPVRQLHQSGSFRIKNPEVNLMKIGSCTSVTPDMKHSDKKYRS